MPSPSFSRPHQQSQGRFKPALGAVQLPGKPMNRADIADAILAQQRRPGASVNQLAMRDQRAMDPPPTPVPKLQSNMNSPQQPRLRLRNHAPFPSGPDARRIAPTPQSNRFFPPTLDGQSSVPQTTSSTSPRFELQSRRNSPHALQTQRVPFVPGRQSGFG